MLSAPRFLREYFRPSPDRIIATEVEYSRGSETLPATLYMQAHLRRPQPGWVLLHGLTVPGRSHKSLIRFARAFAAGGGIVLVPEIPEWRDLRMAPSVAVPTIRSAILALDAREETLPGRIGVVGFSFGATQGLIAAVADELAGHLAGVAAWGGYCELERVFRFALTGEHELDGRGYHAAPDPYARWIMAANYLTQIPGYESADETAAALLELAREAGRRGTFAADPQYDAYKSQLRNDLPADQRELFDLVAPPTERMASPPPEAAAFSDALAAAALRTDPLLDPRPFLPRIPVPLVLAHGRDDRLIPFTESFRLARAVPPERLVHHRVTALFSHSGGAGAASGPLHRAREAVRFVALLDAMLDLV